MTSIPLFGEISSSIHPSFEPHKTSGPIWPTKTRPCWKPAIAPGVYTKREREQENMFRRFSRPFSPPLSLTQSQRIKFLKQFLSFLFSSLILFCSLSFLVVQNKIKINVNSRNGHTKHDLAVCVSENNDQGICDVLYRSHFSDSL